jgi:predicted DNA-binding transcriptional regulator AlpA
MSFADQPSDAPSPSNGDQRRLLKAKEVADKLGISLRQFRRVCALDWFPQAVQLAPQTFRYVEAEVDEAIRRRAPRPRNEEPVQLSQARRAYIESMKTRGVPA